MWGPPPGPKTGIHLPPFSFQDTFENPFPRETKPPSEPTEITRVRELLAQHPEILARTPLDVEQLIRMLDPRWLFQRATAPLKAIRKEVLRSSDLMPNASRHMLRGLYERLDHIEYRLLDDPPQGFDPLTTAGAAGQDDTAVGDLKLAGLYIVWKDLDPDLWEPAILTPTVPLALKRAIELGLEGAQRALMDVGVYWTIQQAINQAKKAMTAVVLVVPPLITPMMLGNGRYDENVDMSARVFTLGVPIIDRVKIRPKTLPGRAVTSQSLFSGQGWENIKNDLETIGKNLAGEIVASTIGAVGGAVETYLLDAVEVALEEALDALGDVIDQVTDNAGDALAEFLTEVQTTPGLDLVYELLSWLQDNVVDQVLPGRESLQRAARAFIMSRIQSLQGDMVRDVYERTDALRSQAVFGFVVKNVNNSDTVVFEEGSLESDIIRRVAQGWYVRIGSVEKRNVVSVDYTEDRAVRYTVKLDQSISVREGDIVVAAPPNVTDDAYTTIVALLWGVSERAQSVIDRNAFPNATTTLINNVANSGGTQQADPAQQRNTIAREADAFVRDLVAQGLGADDYDALRNSDVHRRIIRSIPLQSGDAITVSGNQAQWQIAGGLFTRNDAGRYLAIRGSNADGDYRISSITGLGSGVTTSDTATTRVGTLNNFGLDHTAGMTVQVISRISVRSGDSLKQDVVDALTTLVQGKLQNGIIQAAKDFVEEASNGTQSLQGLEQAVSAAGRAVFSDNAATATAAARNDTENVFRSAGVGDNEGNLTRIFDDLQSRATALGDEILKKVEGAASAAVAEIWANAFIWTCIANFEFDGGDMDEGGGFLGDWSANILVLNTITDNKARRGGGIAVRGALPNILLFNEITDNVASESGGGVQGENIAWPVLVLNRIEGNKARGGGGLDFRQDTFPILLFNEIRENFAIGNPSGCGGGARFQSVGGLLLANEFRRNEASLAGGGLYLDGNVWAMFNEVSRNRSDKIGGGVLTSGGGWVAFNEIRNNESGKYGGNVAANGRGRARFTANSVAHGRAQLGGGWAILGSRAKPRVSDTIKNNRAEKGGGVFIDKTAVANLSGATIATNEATHGGGIYIDGDPSTGRSVRLSGVSVVVNRAIAGRGGGVYTTRRLHLSQSYLVGNLATLEGGGLFAQGTGKINLTRTLFMANLAPKGAGACVYDVQRLTCLGNQFRSNRTLRGSGAGLFGLRVVEVSIRRDVYVRNTTPGRDGAGAYLEGGGSVDVDESQFQQNVTEPRPTGSFGPPPAGGGLLVRMTGTVEITGTEASGNAAELGGAFAFVRCSAVEVTNSRFVHNVADHDRDGFGRGGAIYATGPASRVVVGGEFPAGAGNTFVGNTAGTNEADRAAGAAGTTRGHGGAIAIMDGPIAIVEGNHLKHNAATHDGGAIYFEDTAAGSIIGGDNDALPGAGAWQRYGNAFAINCAVPRFDETRIPCCDEPGMYYPGGRHYSVREIEPPRREQEKREWTETPPEEEEETTIIEDPGLEPPCEGWIFYEESVFTPVARPLRSGFEKRKITFPYFGDVEAEIRAAWSRLPPDVQLYLQTLGLFTPTGGAMGNLELYTLWPAHTRQEEVYRIDTDASRSLMGWDAALDWRAYNAQADGARWQHGAMSVRTGFQSIQIGPIVTRRGAAFALVRGGGTEVFGNQFNQNYAIQFGGAGLVDQSDANTVIGIPPGQHQFGRNDFANNTAALGGALALVGATHAKVIWNRIGGSVPEANYATGGAGICIVRSSPTLGGGVQTTEVVGNLAGVSISEEDRALVPDEHRDLRDAGILAAGGGLLVIGPPNGEGSVISNVPFIENRVVGPTEDPAASVSELILAGGGIAQFDRGRITVKKCLIQSNEVVLLDHETLPRMQLIGGGMAVLKDDTVITSGPRDPFGTSAAGCRVTGNRVRIPHVGSNAPDHDLQGGGIGALLADRLTIGDSYFADNVVLRELPEGDEPSPPVSLRLAGGGISLRDCRDTAVLDSRLERNQLVNVDQQELTEGGGLAINGGNATVKRSWAVNNYSQRNGGGVALRGPGQFLLGEITAACNEALGQGTALYVADDVSGSVVLRSILDGFGAWDQAVAYGSATQNGLRLIDNCIWAPLGIGIGGTLTSGSANLEADPGFTDPDALPEADFTVRLGSPCLGYQGFDLGYQPFQGGPGYNSRVLNVPTVYPTISDAIAAAVAGDIIDVDAGDYAETVDLPTGVVLRAPVGPRATRILVPPNVPPPDELITIGESTRRTAMAGFTIDGTIRTPPGTTGVVTGKIETAILVEPRFQGTLTRLVIHTVQRGIVVDVNVSGAQLHPVWISGNTVAKCDEVCILVLAHKSQIRIPGFDAPCRIETPDKVRSVEIPPVIATIEHNLLVAGPSAAGAKTEGDLPVSSVRLGFNTAFDIATAAVGFVTDVMTLNGNQSGVDPLFADITADDYRLSAGSPALPDTALEDRYRGGQK